MGFDLMLMSKPGAPRPRAEVESVGHSLSQISAIARFCEITPGDRTPSGVDILSLEDALESGDFAVDEFSRFCTEHGLVPDRNEETSAAEFLDSKFGALLATMKMPHVIEEAKHAYSELVQFALARDLRLFDPQNGADVDLRNPGELPAGY